MPALPDARASSHRLEQLGWLFVAIALPALTLLKVNPVDVPWHLATARLAFATGHWPTQNTFSWTYPDYTIYQQYPVFQSIIYAAFRLGGWPALSLLIAVGWSGVFLLFLRWAGPFKRALPFHLMWALVAFSLQTRAALRPDMLSLTLLALLLIAVDLYRERGRAWIALVPLIHLIWVNAHQLFVLSFAIQALFVGHLVLSRLPLPGVDRSDAAVPIGPPLAALAASMGVSFLTPLGSQIIHVFAHTSGSLAHHRDHVQELARIWSDPVWLAISAVIALPTTVVLIRSRRAWNPFEVGAWLLSLALLIAAIRGMAYMTLISGAIVQRTLLRQPLTWRPSPLLRRYGRVFAVTMSGVLALAVIYHRWIRPTIATSGAQAGIGRSVGDWPDAALATLKADPPPGRMMNLPWSLANTIIWSWPEQQVFVDPRFEAYPRAFLIESLASLRDDAPLDRQVAAFHPDWIFGEHVPDNQRARLMHLLRTGDWDLTYADVQTLVLVRRTPGSTEYRQRHRFSPADEPPGLVAFPLPTRARQRLDFARLLLTLGHRAETQEQLRRAETEIANYGGDGGSLHSSLAKLRSEAGDAQQRGVEQHHE